MRLDAVTPCELGSLSCGVAGTRIRSWRSTRRGVRTPEDDLDRSRVGEPDGAGAVRRTGPMKRDRRFEGIRYDAPSTRRWRHVSRGRCSRSLRPMVRYIAMYGVDRGR